MASQITYNLSYDLKDDQMALMPTFSFTRRQVDREFTTVDFFHFSFSNKGENEVVRVQLQSMQECDVRVALLNFPYTLLASVLEGRSR